jgi:hypothetical protein
MIQHEGEDSRTEPSRPERIIPVEDLPPSLWCKNVLHIAPKLARAYCDTIQSHGLVVLADARDPNNPPVGGPTPRAADEHFAQAFDGSVARTELAFLDPKSEMVHIADAFSSLFAGGKIAILDIPSGAGAFALSLLCTLAELRAGGVIPRQPLDVVVIGGEFNPHATDYARELYGQVRGQLDSQAITVEFKPFQWDVCDKVSTTGMVKQFVTDAHSADRKLVAVSNFSGFLTKERKQKAAEPQLEEIFRYSAGSKSTLIWLEPKTNEARKNLFSWFRRAREKVWTLIQFKSGGPKSQDVQAESEVPFALPLKLNSTCVARLLVSRFELRTPSR